MRLLQLIKKKDTQAVVKQAPQLPAKVNQAPLEQLPADARNKADERLRFVKQVQATKLQQNISYPNAVSIVRQKYSDTFQILPYAGRQNTTALTFDNYRRWAATIKNLSLEQAKIALADNYRRGIQPAKGDDRFWLYLYATYLNKNRLPMTVAYDAAIKRLRMDDPEIVPPTENQARYRLKQLDKGIYDLARLGEKTFKNNHIDFIVRDWSKMAPGDLVIGDNRTFDTRVKIFDKEKQRWIAVRPTICALIDARSWYLAAWVITPNAVNATDIINTLGQYVGRYGAPPARGAYFDNGKDFCAQGFSTLYTTPDGYDHSIFAELGMSLTNSIAYNARAKTVEVFFGQVMRQFDKLFADYLGSKPEERTLAASYFDKNPTELPTLDQFANFFAAWLDDWHQKPKKGRIHLGESPQEIWDRREMQALMTPQQYRMAFALPIGVRKVTRGPSVLVDHITYYCDDMSVEDTVLIKKDPVSDEFVHIYKTDGSFIGFAEPRDPINALAENSEEQKRLAELIARQYRQLKEKKTALKELTGGLHLISAMQLLEAETVDKFKLLKMGEIGSVTGSAHKYIRYELADANQAKRLPEAECEDIARKPAMHDEPVDKKLLSIIHDLRHQEADQPQDQAIKIDFSAINNPNDDPDNNPSQIDFRSLALPEKEEY